MAYPEGYEAHLRPTQGAFWVYPGGSAAYLHLSRVPFGLIQGVLGPIWGHLSLARGTFSSIQLPIWAYPGGYMGIFRGPEAQFGVLWVYPGDPAGRLFIGLSRRPGDPLGHSQRLFQRAAGTIQRGCGP